MNELHNNGIAANDNRNILVTFHIKIIVLSFNKEKKWIYIHLISNKFA